MSGLGVPCPSPEQGRGRLDYWALSLGGSAGGRRPSCFCPSRATLSLPHPPPPGRLRTHCPGRGGDLGHRGCGEVAALVAAVAASALGRRTGEDGVGAGAGGAGHRPEFAGMFG